MKAEIKYIAGMKYQLAETYFIVTPVTGYNITDDFFVLNQSGSLLIRKGFPWDGASGPTFDTKSSMRASLVHDVFCILMRDGRISYEKWQDTVNDFFEKMCKEDGMWGWRAGLWHAGVEFGDAGNPKQGRDRPILTAP